jgi:sulfite reductase (NADPH) flavoprotein alpha-component
MDISEIKQPQVFSRTRPYSTRIRERFPLTRPGSTKTTYHISLDLKGSGIEFKPGDSIGVFGRNDPILVEHLIKAMKANGEEIISDPRSKEPIALREFLSAKANLSRLTSSFLKLFHSYGNDRCEEISRLLLQENKPLLVDYLANHDPLDLLKEFHSITTPLQELCAQFGPMLPRFYSVASSLAALPDEVHLTVALFTYSHSGEKRYGVASHFLCHLCEEGKTEVPIYVQSAHAFSLPEDSHAPVIMIGPGTGIAPFRSFLQERVFQGVSGKNWLFFGERHRAHDFFYEDYLLDLQNQNKLVLDTAFSRDQEEKIYVQHLILQKSKQVWEWLQEGAYLYICGDADQMAKDVESALRAIAMKQGGLSEDEAKIYFKQLRASKRFMLDVY